MTARMLNVFSLCFLSCLSWTAATIHMSQSPACSCQDRRLCRPLLKSNTWEVVGYTFGPSQRVYQLFDWKRLTTVVVDGAVSSSFVCFAHGNGAKVHQMVVPSKGDLMSEAARANFVQNSLSTVKRMHLDGLNVDFEGPVTRNGILYNGLTDLMRKLRAALHSENPALELTMAVRYCPFCDGPYVYDLISIKQVANYFVLMDYDLQGVAFSSRGASKANPCLTSRFLSNSPLPLVTQGAQQFVQAGIGGSQLVMALPWYGRSNQCVKFNPGTSSCFVPCGQQFSRHALLYRTIMNILRTSSEQGRIWNKNSGTPTLTHFYQGQRYQVNYDDPVSLRLKWQVALRLGFRGAAIWNIDFLDYSNNDTAARDRQAMWDAIPHGFEFRRP